MLAKVCTPFAVLVFGLGCSRAPSDAMENGALDMGVANAGAMGGVGTPAIAGNGATAGMQPASGSSGSSPSAGNSSSSSMGGNGTGMVSAGSGSAAGSSGAVGAMQAGSSGAAAGDGAAGSAAPLTGGRPPCIGNPGDEVAIIGDSYVTGFGSPELQPALAKLVPAASSYPNYAGAGCSMASGGICTGLYGNVPDQYAAAHGEHANIKLVIMDGGGNDVLIPAAGSPDCKNIVGSSMDEGCKAIVKLSLDTATELLMKMANDGVKDVVFFFYPHIPSVDLGLGGTNANEILDYAYPFAADSCAHALDASGGKLSCHFIDTRKPFADSGSIEGAGPWTNIVTDGVHPSDAGQAVIAQQIANTMQTGCLGQDAASGCCAAQ